jgi:hypothetical protein
MRPIRRTRKASQSSTPSKHEKLLVAATGQLELVVPLGHSTKLFGLAHNVRHDTAISTRGARASLERRAALFFIARQTGIGLGVRLGKNGRDRVDQTGADTVLARTLDIGRPALTTRGGKAYLAVEALVRPGTGDQTPQRTASDNGRQARVLGAINGHIRNVGTGSALSTMQNFGSSCSLLHW